MMQCTAEVKTIKCSPKVNSAQFSKAALVFLADGVHSKQAGGQRGHQGGEVGGEGAHHWPNKEAKVDNHKRKASILVESCCRFLLKSSWKGVSRDLESTGVKWLLG